MTDIIGICSALLLVVCYCFPTPADSYRERFWNRFGAEQNPILARNSDEAEKP